MNATLPAPASRSNSTPARTQPRALAQSSPTDAERALIAKRVQAIASCPMFATARRIVAKTEELAELLDTFTTTFGPESIVRAVRKAGQEVNEEVYRSVAQMMLHDALGFAWALETFIAMFNGELLDENAGRLVEADLQKPR